MERNVRGWASDTVTCHIVAQRTAAGEMSFSGLDPMNEMSPQHATTYRSGRQGEHGDVK